MSDDEAVAWLRKQVEGDRAAAEAEIRRYELDFKLPGTPAQKMAICGRELDRIADCEAKVAILAEHGDEHMCYSNSHDGNTWDWWIGDCRVMVALASAYRHREGYTEHWEALAAT